MALQSPDPGSATKSQSVASLASCHRYCRCHDAAAEPWRRCARVRACIREYAWRSPIARAMCSRCHLARCLLYEAHCVPECKAAARPAVNLPGSSHHVGVFARQGHDWLTVGRTGLLVWWGRFAVPTTADASRVTPSPPNRPPSSLTLAL